METLSSANMGRRRLWLVVVILLALVSMASCITQINAFFDVDRNPVQRISATKVAPPTRLEVNATVVSVDPLRNAMKVELSFRPYGEIIEANGRDMARDVHLLTNNAQGQSEFVFHQHHEPHPVEVTLTLENGEVAQYPMDRYTAQLQLESYIERGADDETPVPLAINFLARNHALAVEAALGAGSEAHEVHLDLNLRRPLAVQGFAWFINALMVMLALSSAIVVFNVAYRGKKLEPNLLVWMSALLFVLPGMRNTLPGVPPLGSFTDFLVFFWVEAVVTVCLFIMVLTWYGRVPDK